MPETTYSTTTRLSPDELWAFVQDMDNWAPYMVGYQSHEKLSDELSQWTLKGDAGPLARTVNFQVRVTEWNGPERVAFELEGINEDMRGGGSFEIREGEGEPAEVPRNGILGRLFAALLRALGIRKDRAAPRGNTHASFTLRVEPGGPMAPMISAMIQPALQPAARSLVHQVLDHLEGGKRV